MRKKLLSTLLALCMVLALLSGTVQAAGETQSGKYGDLTWEYDGGILTISGSGNMPDTSTDIPWDQYSRDVSTVIIENGVTNIGNYAFSRFNNLTHVNIPDSVTVIGSWAFAWCSSLTSIDIPSSVTTIDSCAFYECTSLASITIPGTVNEISFWLFYNCSNLSEIIIQDGVKYVERAFEGCSKLTHISVPASVIRIGRKDIYNSVYEVFSGCTNLAEIKVDNANTEYSSQDGALFTKEKSTILYCPLGKTSFTIPSSASAIGSFAFSDCTKLVNLTIPSSVKDIGYGAFRGCNQLVTITIPEGVTSLGGTFSGCSNLETVNLPVSLTRIASDTFYNCLKLKSIVYSGTETQWGKINIENGNAELKNVKFTFLDQSTPSTPDNPNKPDTPDKPTTPGTLSLTVANGGLGKKVTVKIEAGHWLTVQTRRGGSISVTSVQAPADASRMSSVTISASAGSVLQIWETETEMQFSNGVPTTPILNTATRSL